jgi:NitT/TauT family transport system substrate-binding protein
MLMQGETIRFVSSRRDPLTRPADFKGKTIGIPSKKGTSETTLDLVLRAGHVDPGDVERQVVGLSPGVYELVQRGRLDAYIVGVDVAVTLQKKNVGAVLFDPSTVVTAGQGYMVTERSLEQNRDTLQRYLRAVRAGVDSILADDRLDTTLKSMRTKYHFPTLADDAVAKESIRQVKKAWLAAGRDNVLKTVPERWKKTYDELVALGEIKGGADPSKWYTNELADRAAA